jgi:hypothetical protein
MIICVSLEVGKMRVSVTSSLSLITLSIFAPTPLQSLLLRPNVSYIVLPKSRSAVHIYKVVYARKGERLLQSEMELKNGLKLDCHHAQNFVMDEDFVEVVASLFVNCIAMKPHAYTVYSPENNT